VQDTLNAVHEVEDSRPFWKKSMIAFLLTLGAVTLGLLHWPCSYLTARSSAPSGLTWV
jgi:uncharacterized BrkB/YihY/UPF0761 family membrane protein